MTDPDARPARQQSYSHGEVRNPKQVVVGVTKTSQRTGQISAIGVVTPGGQR